MRGIIFIVLKAILMLFVSVQNALAQLEAETAKFQETEVYTKLQASPAFIAVK